MKMTATERCYASERLQEFFNLSTGVDPKTIEENTAVAYGKLDPINVDEIPNTISSLGTSLSLANRKHQDIVRRIIETNDMKFLLDLHKRVLPKAKLGQFRFRLFSYLINARLTELDIAPRWREISKVSKPKDTDWSVEQRQFLCDLQVFDLQWLHAKYRDHRMMNIFSDVMENIFKGDNFDYALAQIIAHADFKISNKIRYLKLNEDIQSELSMLRLRNIDSDMRKLERNAEQVEMDLQLAANRNRNRGKKLRAVIPDWVRLWKSTRVLDSSSISLMHENYQKISGKKISRRTYTDKLKRLNEALKEVDSYHTLDFLIDKKSPK